jgi:CheY-like chemotaxis protein
MKQILVVDDEPKFAEICRDYLERCSGVWYVSFGRESGIVRTRAASTIESAR